MLILDYERVQAIAKAAMAHLAGFVCTGLSVRDVAAEAERYMHSSGIESFWYYGIGAFVFAGEDTVISISGREYAPAERRIAANDVVTVDLSPQVGEVWGDFARTLVIESGAVKTAPETVENAELREGLAVEVLLHRRLMEVARRDMTFEELYLLMNAYIAEFGYENLDFGGNLGHSIDTRRERRIYIERGNRAPLSATRFFTFEPHIMKRNGAFGFKREDIYFFEGSELRIL